MATFADGLAVRVAIPEAVALMVTRRRPDAPRLRARDGRTRSASYDRAGIRAEGAAASALAALPQLAGRRGARSSVIVTGRNIDDDALPPRARGAGVVSRLTP